jgi:HAD superfamily hydrolase (TIGR01509 family)
MKQLEAIIFDVDGTLADTEEVHRRAFNRAFKEFELDWNWTPKLYEELLTISGGRERITYYGADLIERFKHHDRFSHFARDMHEVKTRIYAEMLNTDEVPLRPGVERLLNEAREAGLTLAIATSSTFSNLKTLLDRNLPDNWMSWFSAIATCDTVSDKKPSPAVYQSVLDILELDPAYGVAIEDTVNGCLAATGAGLATVITTHFFTRNHHFPNAALVVDSLGEDDYPFKPVNGNAGDSTLVDVALLRRIAAERKERDNTEWDANMRLATA